MREISVVVIGVAITLFASSWITNRNEKRDMALCLNAIIIELERNANAFDDYAKRLHKSTRYTAYIRSHDEKSVSQDSIMYYSGASDESDDDRYGIGWGALQSETLLIKDAFEMFKTFGSMRNVANKEVLISIWEIYNRMENVQRFIDEGFQMKREIAMNELPLRLEGKVNAPMRLFYFISMSQIMESQCKEISEIIRLEISKLEEAKIVKR